MSEKSSGLRCFLAAGILILFFFAPSRSWPDNSAVSLRREIWTIPTYLPGPPEKLPMFYFGRAYQGAQGPIYPYPFLDVLTDERVDKAYTALILENDYVRYCVLPEVGGRIFEAIDKTDGYHFFYRQQVIKPALIGMLGAWISGGVEWNIPHHHRATTFLPVDWTTTESGDGAKTIWVGELELRHRMRWLVGLTLRPGTSALEVSIRIINRTPFAHSALCWANAAVHANENYQVVFPPSTQLATFHGKNQFCRWPVSHEFYNGVDYSRGVDLSWWKSHPSPTSFFAFGSEEDFFAGYDHGRASGVVFVGDHTSVPGKKLWTWGTGSEGARWEKILTDADGPYLELMFGSFSDNQPDYSWVSPGEVKSVTQHWYPLRSVGAVKNANSRGACNLEVKKGGRAFLGVVTPSFFREARITLTAGERMIFQTTADVGPGEPATAEVDLPPKTAEESLRLSLATADGREVISYRPEKRESPPLPDPVIPPRAPQEMGTNEELYLAGLRLEQFYNPSFDPSPYYEEALRRDAGDSRVLTARGRICLMKGLFEEAEAHFRAAAARLGRDFTRPKDGEALYYLGLALKFLDRTREAEEAFGRAGWDSAWTSAAALEMAEIAAQRGDYPKALEQAERALRSNVPDGRAGSLRVVLLRKLGRLDEAWEAARKQAASDPLDFWAANELSLVQAARGQNRVAEDLAADLKLKMRDAVENYLELAVDYADCGLYDESVALLDRLIRGKTQAASHPLVLYDSAYYLHKLGMDAEAGLKLQAAAETPLDYAFPFRLEELAVLGWAVVENPRDSRAYYLLGNLLFDRQPEKAMAAWERAISLDDDFAAARRNLGIALARIKNDLPCAIVELEKAVASDPNNPRLYSELDELYDLSDVPPFKRLERLSKNQAVVAGRDDALSREIVLLVELGQYDRAIELLKSHHFHVWEGGGEIHDVYVDAHLGRGREALAEGRPGPALRDFLAALEYPENLEAGRPASGGRDAEVYYSMGLAQEAGGDKKAAGEAFARSAASPGGPSEASYYRGLSRRKTGRESEARAEFERLVRYSRERLQSAPARDYFAKFGERESVRRQEARLQYSLGLGLRGLGDEAGATNAFRRSLELYPYFSRARRELQRPG
jgi:tetratricopeptide (TPR) repeat protein